MQALQLLETHIKRTKEYIATGKYREWVEFKSQQIDQEKVKFVKASRVSEIERVYSISIPGEIKYFYEEVGTEKFYDFIHTVDKYFERKEKLLIATQFSKVFAQHILETYLSKSDTEKEYISSEIEIHDTAKSKSPHTSDLFFLMVESCIYFDWSNNKFTLPFLQKEYERLGSDKNLLNHILITWCHCGGCGGILLNTPKKGFEAICEGDEDMIKYNGEEYPFCNSPYNDQLKHHLEEYKTEIERDLSLMSKFNLFC